MKRILRETNRFLNMLIEASPDGIIVTDAKGDIIMYNKAAERILGYTNEDVIGRANVKSLYPKGLARRIRELLMDDRVGGKGVLPPRSFLSRTSGGRSSISAYRHLSSSARRATSWQPSASSRTWARWCA